MKALVLVLCSIFTFQEIPLKSQEEFELKLDFQFKQRPQTEQTNKTGEKIFIPTTPLPFLSAEIVIVKLLEDEARMKVLDHSNNVLATKNLDKGLSMKFDLGFTDDLKDQVASHKYFIHLYSKEKQISRSVVILFEKDGTFYVNGEKRGKI